MIFVFNCERAGVSTLAHILTHKNKNKQWTEKHARNAISSKKKQCSANQPPERIGWRFIVNYAKMRNGKNEAMKRNAIRCLE